MKNNHDVYLSPEEVDKMVEELEPIISKQLEEDEEFQREIKTNLANLIAELDKANDPVEIKKILDKYAIDEFE